MSLKNVLTELGSAIRAKSKLNCPLTLQDMTQAVKNISTGSSVKFYRCAEYSPAATVIYVEHGLITLADGRKISLAGEYTYQEYSWICSATTAHENYQSAAIIIMQNSISNGTHTNSYWGFSELDSILQPFAKTADDSPYIAETIFHAVDGSSIDREIVLTGSSMSFVSCFSGYEITYSSGFWQQSAELTRGIPAAAYTPEPGRIYSNNSSMAVNSIYPEVPLDIFKFYECTAYTPDFPGGLQYSFTLSGAADAKVNGTYIRKKWSGTVDEASEDYTSTAKWVNENGCTLIEEYGWGEYNYSIWDDNNNQLYMQDGPNWSRVTDYNKVIWADTTDWLQVTLNFSAWQTTELPPTAESWSGYEMIKYNPEYSFIVSGADKLDCNGIYTIAIFDSAPNNIVYSNGTYFLCTHVGIDLQHDRWTICDNPAKGAGNVNYFYTTDSFRSTEKISPTQAVWRNNIKLSPPPAGWIRSDILKENMPVYFQKPKVGEIYSADTSIRVRKMYDGAVYPITSDGLVFYAALQQDYVDTVSGTAAVAAGGSFTNHNGISCLELDGSEYVKWADNSDLPEGNAPYSFVVLVAPTDNYEWKCYLSMGAYDGEEICIHAKNGRLEEFAPANIKADGSWQALALTRDETGDAKTYINGKLDGSGSRTNAISTPVSVCVGAQVNNFTQKFKGYIAFAAIYNRELSAEEVAGIHKTLLDM